MASLIRTRIDFFISISSIFARYSKALRTDLKGGTRKGVKNEAGTWFSFGAEGDCYEIYLTAAGNVGGLNGNWLNLSFQFIKSIHSIKFPYNTFLHNEL